MAALFALDETLGRVLRTTTQPVIGQMRLAWWRETLASLDVAPLPAEAVLTALAREVLPHGVTGAALARCVDGWERLLVATELTAGGLGEVAADRGGTVFAAGAAVLGGRASAAMAQAGEAWALADLAVNLRDGEAAATARGLAGERWRAATRERWPSRLRPLGLVALEAVMRADGEGGWRRRARLLRFRAIGR